MDRIRHLPPVTRPAAEPLARTHSPRPAADYTAYRPCLRWDFGFTCAFCLVHETDLFPHGADRTGLIWIEHRELRSRREDLTTDYGNCYLSCRFCNGARQDRPVVAADGRLLDPCADAWARHFAAERDRLVPLPADPDAARTHRVYDLDDARKVEMRRSRRESVEEAVAVVREVPDLVRVLRASPALDALPSIVRERAADQLLKRLRQAAHQLGIFAPVPSDAPPGCRCKAAQELPAFLQAQLLETAVPERTD